MQHKSSTSAAPWQQYQEQSRQGCVADPELHPRCTRAATVAPKSHQSYCSNGDTKPACRDVAKQTCIRTLTSSSSVVPQKTNNNSTFLLVLEFMFYTSELHLQLHACTKQTIRAATAAPLLNQSCASSTKAGPEQKELHSCTMAVSEMHEYSHISTRIASELLQQKQAAPGPRQRDASSVTAADLYLWMCQSISSSTRSAGTD